jgi:hypothetical protein
MRQLKQAIGVATKVIVDDYSRTFGYRLNRPDSH